MVPVKIKAQALRRPQPAPLATNALTAFPIVPDGSASHSGEAAPQLKAHWRQADVKRAIVAAEQAGLEAYRVEIAPDGTLAIIVGDPAETATPDS